MAEAALDTDEGVEEETDLKTETDEDEDHVFTVDDKVEPDEKKDEPDFETKYTELETQFTTQSEKFKTLEENLEKLTKENNRMAYQLRKGIKAEPKEDDKVEFTDAQLQGLLETHKDDPAAMLQIMKLVSQQESKKGKDEAIDAVNVSNNKKEMDTYLETMYPDIKDEASPFRQDVDKTKTWLGMSDHPYGDFLATSVMVFNELENIISTARDEGKELALKGSAESERKKTIKSNALNPVTGKKGKSAALPTTVEDTIKQMNMDKKQAAIYRKLMANKSKSVAMEA